MIGIFDSGLGGLSVLAAIARALPRADLVYLADTAHVPYGPRDDAFIRGRVLSIGQLLVERGCTLIVCGLNSQPGSLLYRSGFIDHLGDDNVCTDMTHALQRAYLLLPNIMGGFEEEY